MRAVGLLLIFTHLTSGVFFSRRRRAPQPVPVDCALSGWETVQACSKQCGPDGTEIQQRLVFDFTFILTDLLFYSLFLDWYLREISPFNHFVKYLLFFISFFRRIIMEGRNGGESCSEYQLEQTVRFPINHNTVTSLTNRKDHHFVYY